MKRPAEDAAVSSSNVEGKGVDTDKQEMTEENKKPKVLKFEATYLRSISSASQYEKSFMHRDVITHAIATQTDFIITASIDGHLKFWKKKYAEGVEFVKHFRCHLFAFTTLAVNFNGTLLCTVCSQDKSVKIFDVENFDMINMFKLDFSPRTAAWIHQGSQLLHLLAVSDSDSGKIYVFDGKGAKEPLHIFDNLHRKSVRLIEYNHQLDLAISADDSGMIEYWCGKKNEFQFPSFVKFESKMDTDLYEFLKIKTLPVAMCMSPDGKKFATLAEDRRIRVFDVLTGKIEYLIDETMPKYIEQAKQNRNFGLQSMEWNRRLALEKDLDKERSTSFRFTNLVWDHSSNFLIYPSPIGIKVYNTVTHEVVRIIGREETMRFIAVTICRAVPDIRSRLQGAAATIETEAADNPTLNKRTDPDPVLVAIANKKSRFYLFTNQEPYSTEDDEEGGTGRDIFNEKPKKEEIITAIEGEGPSSKWSEKIIMHTSYGDIHMKLYPEECPKAVENFCTHVRRGYYNGLLFHRVIKAFMIQTGDPTGKGTGGNSIWGEDFEDEFHPRLRFDKPYKVAMANAGPNSNGSQFFITVVPAEWLDGKNTLFGEVTEGFNVVQKINNLPVYEKSGRPREEVRIVSVTLK
ncbi:unnamed protein product, partial [Mesorhabditis belari]|uniref:peptidylprolyl isomerase n=1 Tax=Mesorhabditis belari TaxID=2138241 RepID=A0AAF3F088_9BILA